MNLRTHAGVLRFVQAAREFRWCAENVPSPADGPWVRRLAQSVAALYASAYGLPEADLPEDETCPEREFAVGAAGDRVFDAVNRAFEGRAGYRMFYDPFSWEASEPVCGLLGDDIADIYRDIVPGLRAWDTGNTAYDQEVLFEWIVQFMHGGKHAIDALNALHWTADGLAPLG